MTRPINIEIIAKTAEYIRSVKGAEVSTEDLAEALVAVTESSDDLNRRLSRAMRDAAKDAEVLERAVEGIGTATRDAAAEAESAMDGVDDSMRRTADGARDAGREVGDSFRGSLGESLASGSGDLSESLSETLGEAVGNAPLPLAAIGTLALLVWNHFKTESEKRKKELSELFDLTDLLTGAIDKTKQFEEAISDLGDGDLGTGLDEANELAGRLGITMGDVAAVITGEVNPASEGVRATLQAIVDQARLMGQQNKTITPEMQEQVEAAERLLGIHRDNAAELETNKQRTEGWQQAYLGVNRAVLDLVKHIADVDANMDDAVDATDQMILKAADINADGFLDQLEIANAGLEEAVAKSGKLDPGMPTTVHDVERVARILQGLPKDIQVKVKFFAENSIPGSANYSPGFTAITDHYRRKYGSP